MLCCRNAVQPTRHAGWEQVLQRGSNVLLPALVGDMNHGNFSVGSLKFLMLTTRGQYRLYYRLEKQNESVCWGSLLLINDCILLLT